MMRAARESLSLWLLRLALAAAFFSAVADRFSLWGGPGAAGVAWGDWAHFQAYSNQLNTWLPAALRVPAAYGATAAELVLGLGLLLAPRSPWPPLASALLLLTFALAMTANLGPKPALDYSVWTAAAASLVLATRARGAAS